MTRAEPSPGTFPAETVAPDVYATIKGALYRMTGESERLILHLGMPWHRPHFAIQPCTAETLWRAYGEMLPAGALHGLKIIAVAVVAQAVWGMAKSLCTDVLRVTIMAAATCAVLVFPTAQGQIAVIVVAAILGLLLFRPAELVGQDSLPLKVRRRTGGLFLAALYIPVWTIAIQKPQDFGLGLAAFVALLFWKLPPWLVVMGTGAVGWLVAAY